MPCHADPHKVPGLITRQKKKKTMTKTFIIMFAVGKIRQGMKMA